MRSFSLDLGNPISKHPDNAGLALALIGHPCVPGVGGGSGRWPDLARKTAGGTLVNGPTWTVGQGGQWGLSLNGSTQYITLPASSYFHPSQTSPFSLLVSIFINSFSSGRIFNSQRAAGSTAFNLFVSGTNTISCSFLGTGASGGGAYTGAFSTGDWHRIGIVYTGTTRTLYAAGRIDTAAVSASLSTSAGSADAAFIGSLGGGAGTFLNGQVAGFRYYSRALTTDEVARDYQWFRDPATDPRLNRVTGRTYYLPTSPPPPPSASFAPAFGPGWGFAA